MDRTNWIEGRMIEKKEKWKWKYGTGTNNGDIGNRTIDWWFNYSHWIICGSNEHLMRNKGKKVRIWITKKQKNT